MKKSMIFLFLIGVVIFASGCDFQNRATNCPDKKDTGRFQLFQGYFNTFGPAAGNQTIVTDEEGIFKIDTVTGEIWKYEHFFSDGAWNNRWDKISE